MDRVWSVSTSEQKGEGDLIFGIIFFFFFFEIIAE